MRNHLGGLNASASYTSRALDLNFGGSWSYYTCPHWGELDWVDGMDAGAIGGRWYDNDVDKQDANLFARANWQAAHGLRLFADIQYRYVRYEAWGTNDNYIGQEGMPMQPIDVDKTYHFFNPRAGVSYRLGERNSFFFSFAVAQKEPTRGDFTDRYMFTADYTYPSSEKLYDWELGYTYTAPRLSLGVNLYYMKYKDQLVPMGRINDGYDALNDNVDDSYRRGVELSASWKVSGWFTASANATFSQNRIENYTELRTVYDNDRGLERHQRRAGSAGHHETRLLARNDRQPHSRLPLRRIRSGFPHAVRRRAVLREQRERRAVARRLLRDEPQPVVLFPHAKRPAHPTGLAGNNLFNAEYENNGYGYSTWFRDSPSQHTALYFPQAPLNVLANVTVKF